MGKQRKDSLESRLQNVLALCKAMTHLVVLLEVDVRGDEQGAHPKVENIAIVKRSVMVRWPRTHCITSREVAFAHTPLGVTTTATTTATTAAAAATCIFREVFPEISSERGD